MGSESVRGRTMGSVSVRGCTMGSVSVRGRTMKCKCEGSHDGK